MKGTRKMKPEIKQRIEQIKAGQVPDGYKRTKIGVIPAEWNICKLKDVLEKQTMKNKDNIVKNVLTNSAAKGIVSQTDFFEKQIANSDNTSGYYIVKNGYFVYNPRISVSAPCGPFNKYYGEKDGIMSPLYTVYKYKDASEYYSEFLSLYFSGSSWYSYMNSIANYGARSDRMNVTSADMDNMPFPYPPLAEQEKIVKILSVQDRIIELYQRKIEELQKMKKIYLSKMFPKKGENAPEWRFPQFTTPWEQRKLGEIGKARSGIGFPDSEQGGKEGIPFYKVSDMNLDGNEIEMTVANNYVSTEQIARKKWSPLEDVPAIYFAKVGAAVMLNRKRLCRKPFLFDNNTMAYSLNIKYWNTEFAKAEFSKIDLTRLVQVGALPSYNANDVDAISIVLPSLEEQQKIGAYFANLDNLITFHQRKLEETKKYKKALMQLLLTGIVRCE